MIQKLTKKPFFITFAIVCLLLACLVQSAWAALEGEKTITFTYSEWKPVFYLEEDGQAKGIFGEIITELFEEKLGLKLAFELVPWKRSQLYIKNGKADFTIMIPTEERLKYAEPSRKAVYQFYMNVFTYNNHPKLSQIKTIRTALDIKKLGLIPATNLGNGWHKKNIDDFGVATRYLNQDVQLFKYLALKRADIVIDLLAPSLYHIRDQNLEDDIEITDTQFGPLDMHLMISRRSKYIDLLPEINDAFDQLQRDGVIDQIINKYERF